MDYTTDEFIDCLCLKNQLVHAPLEKMLEEYQNYDSYEEFLLAMLVLRDSDSAFLLYNEEFSNKILRVLQIHRFDAINQDLKSTINDIIAYVNYMKSLSPNIKELLKQEYRVYHEDVREIVFADDECFLYSLAYDAIVLSSLQDSSLDMITEDDMFLASVNYLMEVYPELLRDDTTFQLLSDRIDKLARGNGIFTNKICQYSRQTKKRFQNFQKEE